ncbi:unnamed protein product [Brassicogethes aeneus]|uniref:C2H2-type domain-containing protein n=1 Tax=Brassicogethes aeneus TaxID=1431903 RepID=A0A9P0B5V0_BRAAE|nr:unnamed protein product [Brassicogethes aeneus]
MLENQEVNLLTKDYNNIVTIPIEVNKSNTEYHNVEVILSDGTVCLLNQYDSMNILQQDDIFSNIEFIEQPKTKNVRTILLPPPNKQKEPPPLKPLAPKTNNVVFKCIKCDEEFNTIGQYRKHMGWHKTERKFKCTKCSSGFNVESNFKIHMAMHGEGRPTCPICNLKFQRSASLKSHLLIHQVEETYFCDECKAEFDKEEELIKHLEVHATSVSAESKALICSYCKLEFDNFSKLKEHISHHIKAKRLLNKRKRAKKKTKKDGKFVCDLCNKGFIKQSLLERHERIHTGIRPYVCNLCHKSFTQSGTLQIHLKRHEGIRPYECTLCPAKFGQKGNLKVHIQKTHTASSANETKYKCFHCSCIFKKISSLNAHMTKLHTKADGSDSVIHATMDQLKKLEKHTESHWNEANLISQGSIKTVNFHDGRDDFGYLTTDESSIKVPDLVHQNDLRKFLVRQRKIGDTRFYFCNYCMKKFKKPSDLIRHIRIHTKEKPFKCKVCNASFSLKSTLLTHSKRHQLKREYICPICNGSFSNLQKITIHLRRHNVQSPSYSCKQCDKTFQSYADAENHSRLYEKNEKHLVVPLFKPATPPPYNNNTSVLKPRVEAPEEVNVKKVFQCSICLAKFSRVINYKKHLQLHQEKKTTCRICTKSFRTPFSLNVHMKSHLNIRNYQCNVCPKKFVTAHILKRHSLVHMTQRPFGCWYCDKHFKTLLMRKQHMKRVHKVEDVDKPELNASEHIPTTVLDFTDMVNEEIPLIEKPSNQISVIASTVHSENTNETNVLQLNSDATNQQTYYDIPTETIQILTENNSASLLQEQNGQLETIYINSDNANVYSELKLQNNDCLLLNSISDLQDPKILFNSGTLSSEINYEPQEIINVNQFFANTSEQIAPDENREEPKNNEGLILNSLLTSNVLYNSNVNFASEESNLLNGDLMGSEQMFAETVAESDNYEDTNYICEKCNKLYANISDFKDHDCTDVPEKETNVVQEKEDENGDSGLKCTECNKTVKTKSALAKHSETHSKEKKSSELKTCSFCQKAFKKNCDLQRHIRTHTGEKPFACDLCDKSFALKSTLASHKKTHEPVVTKNFNCSVCNSFFVSKSTLKIHMNSHTGIRQQFSCSFCGLKFKTMQSKNSHEEKKHKQPQKEDKPVNNISRLLASVANDFTAMENIELNQNTHLPEIVTSDLTQELEVVPNDILQQLQSNNIIIQNPLNLDLPSIIRLEDLTLLNFKTVSVENPEVLSTEDATEVLAPPPVEKPRNFECDVCHKKYTSKDILRKHRKTHGLDKNFFCDSCKKGFDTQVEMDKHNKLHVGYRPHSCKYCANSFADVKGLNAHMKRIHSNINEMISDKFGMQLELLGQGSSKLF